MKNMPREFTYNGYTYNVVEGGIFTMIYDGDDCILQISSFGQSLSDKILFLCIDAFFSGLDKGKEIGEMSKQAEIRKALGL